MKRSESDWKSRGWAFLFLWTVPVILATVLGFFGRYWWLLDLMSHFRLQYLVLLAFAALVLLAGRHKRRAAIAGAFAAVNLCVVLPLYFGDHEDSSTPTLRIVMANVYRPGKQYDRVVDFVARSGADVVVLLEVDGDWDRELRRLETRYPYFDSVPRNGNFGLAIYSRLPLEEVRFVELGPYEFPTVVAHLDFGGQRWTVIGTHPPPPMGKRLYTARNRQLDELAKLISEETGPIVVVGDLNTTSWSPFFGDLLRASGLRDSRPGFGVQPSWPRARPLLRIPIDHCLVSSKVVVRNRSIGPDVGSDHYPLIVDVSLGSETVK